MAKKNRGNSRSQKPQSGQKAPKTTQAAVQNQTITPQMLSESEEQQLLRRVHETDPEWKLCAIAKRRFMSLPAPLQTGAGKEACIHDALASHRNLISDSTRFGLWMADEAKKLVRVWDFEETCRDAGVDPMTVAQHLILEGKGVCNAIKMEGLAAYGSRIRLFVEPLFKDELNLFTKSQGEANHE